MAYWDPDDPTSTLTEWTYDSHAVPPGTYGTFVWVDVPNFVSGDYLLSAVRGDSAALTPLAQTYLNAYISVPEPSSLALLAMGFLLVFSSRVVRRLSP